MFKNLDGFKKVHEDDSKAIMQHKKGHTITVALGALPSLQRKQLKALPLHKCSGGSIAMAKGGSVQHYDDGTGDVQDQGAVTQPGYMAAPPTLGNTLGEDPQAIRDPNYVPPGTTVNLSPQDLQAAGQYQSTSQPAPASVSNDQQQAQSVQPATSDLGLTNQGTIQAGKNAINEQQKIDAANAQASQALLQKQIADETALNGDAQNNYKDFATQQQHVISDIQNNRIDPKHYMENMSTGARVGNTIAVMLGGLSTPFTHQSNPAMDFLNKQIDRDIDGQKARMDQSKTLLGANQAIYHDSVLANNQTRINMNDILAHKIQLQAANMGTPQAHQKAQEALYQLGQQNKDLIIQNSNRATLLKATQGGGSIDPAQLVRFTNAPQPDQAKMYDEIKTAQNINAVRNPSLDAFDKAAQEVRPFSGGTGTSLTAIVPGLDSPGQKAFSGLANTTVKEIEGTARKAAMDSLEKNYRPNFGDSDATIASKRSGWQNYLNSQASAPVAKGYGLDLNNFKTTGHAMQAPASLDGQTASDARGNKIINRGGKWVPFGR